MEIFRHPYADETKHPVIYAKTLVIRKFTIKLKDVTSIAGKDWDEIRKTLESRLKEQGFLRVDVMADALIEEAKARASRLLKKYLGIESPNLIDKVAKYIIAFALAEKFINKDNIYIYEKEPEITRNIINFIMATHTLQWKDPLSA